MPRGKVFTSGATFTGFNFSEKVCCEELLMRDRKKGHSEPTDGEKAAFRTRILRAIGIYIGHNSARPPPTWTEAAKNVNSIRMAAKKLLVALKSKDRKRIKKRQSTLRERIAIGEIGDQKRRILQECFRRQNRNRKKPHTRFRKLEDWNPLLALEKYIDCYVYKLCPYDVLSMPAAHMRTLKTLASIEFPKPDRGGFVDPPLYILVYDLACVWWGATGKRPMPKLISKGSSEKMFLFAEWVQEVIKTAWEELDSASVAAKRAYDERRKESAPPALSVLTSNIRPNRVRKVHVEPNLPKEGTILDIMRDMNERGAFRHQNLKNPADTAD